MSQICRSIEAWFRKHQADDEFARDCLASTCFAPDEPSGVLVIATKTVPACLAREHDRSAAHVGVLWLPALLSEPVADWLDQQAAGHTLWFLGDMDPADLLLFAWVRERLAPKPLRYLGVSDRYLEAVVAQIPPSYLLACTPVELETVAALPSMFPDYRDVVGETCSRWLAGGKKLEIDAVVSSLGSPDLILSPALGDIDKS